MRRLLLLATAAIAVSGFSSSVQAGSGYVHCNPHPDLSGRLRALGTSCSTARRVSFDYFASTPPGQHVGRAHVHGFLCEGAVRAGGFHINCGRGRAHTRFVGWARR